MKIGSGQMELPWSMKIGTQMSQTTLMALNTIQDYALRTDDGKIGII